MGSALSTEEMVENVTTLLYEMRKRISTLETHVSSLQKNVMDIQLSDDITSEKILSMEDHMFNLSLLEEGRSTFSSKKFHTRSNYRG